MGQPVGMVRLMACRDTPTLRRSLFMIGIYYALIYLPLVVTFVCARALYPTDYLAAVRRHHAGDGPAADGRLAAAGRADPGGPVRGGDVGGGRLPAADVVRAWCATCTSATSTPTSPSAASSGSVTARRRWSGVLVTLLSLRPPHYLAVPDPVHRRRHGLHLPGADGARPVLAAGDAGRGPGRAGRRLRHRRRSCTSSAGSASARRARRGRRPRTFAPVYLLTLDPVLWGLAVSFVLAIVVSLLTAPPPDKHVDEYFLADQAD